MTLEPDENRPRAAGTSPLVGRSSVALDLRFLDLDFRIEAPSSEDLLWLEEFLGPAFSAVTNTRSGVEVVLRIDPDRVDRWLADGPAGDERIAFRLDQRVTRLPLWRTGHGGERVAWDERSRAFYRVRPDVRRIEVWCREPGHKARRALMRAVREVAIDHAARSQGLLLHASCLDSGSGAIAFSGPKGCGKTTLLISALAGSTNAFLANDRVFVDLSRDPPHAMSLPSIVSIRASSLRHFPELARGHAAKRWSPWVRWQDLPDQVSSAGGPSGERHQGMSPFQFRRWLGCAWTAEAPLRLIALPRVESNSSEVRIRRLSSEDIEERLPSLLFAAGTSERSELFAIDPGEPAWQIHASCSLLAARVPMVELCLPPDRVDASIWFDDLTRHGAGTVA